VKEKVARREGEAEVLCPKSLNPVARNVFADGSDRPRGARRGKKEVSLLQGKGRVPGGRKGSRSATKRQESRRGRPTEGGKKKEKRIRLALAQEKGVCYVLAIADEKKFCGTGKVVKKKNTSRGGSVVEGEAGGRRGFCLGGTSLLSANPARPSQFEKKKPLSVPKQMS